jgi:sugar/nucleoside kinase (ribokinase family)
MSGLDYLAVGHISVDTLDGYERALGGTVLYAAMAARNLGARVGIHTSAAVEPGLSETLANVSINLVPARHSTRLDIRYDPSGKRHQIISEIAEQLTLSQVPETWRKTRLVHFAPECHEIEPALLDGFPNAFVAVTPQGWLRQWDASGEIRNGDWAAADQVLGRANAVVVSEDDLMDPEMIRLWAGKTSLLVVTRAAYGCDVYVRGADEPYHSVAFRPAKELDPTGAGDVFAAAYFWQLLQGGTPTESADWANCVASFVVEQYGCSGIPTLEDVRRRWANGERL